MIGADNKVMGVKELATYLKKSRGWVYRNRADLPHRAQGRSIFFHRDAIDRWLMQSEATVQESPAEAATRIMEGRSRRRSRAA